MEANSMSTSYDFNVKVKQNIEPNICSSTIDWNPIKKKQPVKYKAHSISVQSGVLIIGHSLNTKASAYFLYFVAALILFALAFQGYLFMFVGFFFSLSIALATKGIFKLGERIEIDQKAYLTSEMTSLFKCDRKKGNTSDIKAVQLTNYFHQKMGATNNSATERFICYEVNIILNNGNRIALAANSNEDNIQELAIKVSEYLGIPILKRKI
jgi:hypothetical protein